MAATQIVSREAADEFDAFQWAKSACRLGWRVVCCFPDRFFVLCVWAEAPADADPDEWDREKSLAP